MLAPAARSCAAIRPRPPGAVTRPMRRPCTFASTGSASRPSLSIRCGACTSEMPCACSARAVPSPTVSHGLRCASASRSREAAAATAAGLVNTTRSQFSARCSWRTTGGPCRRCNRHGERAKTCPPSPATARRSATCWPCGRSEIRVQAASEPAAPVGIVWSAIACIMRALRCRGRCSDVR
ncbi:hypothetical protein G6F51_013882 [Rhizopus arrhizus]|uniref:Uncharacterized protein n=1 Tax=Rhizopus oryzae TaxID=64495 RepID=A0A9P6XQ36_RHIOR|nr:hypothetical protein G6F51_013882 [Rhizopus arrhizus]